MQRRYILQRLAALAGAAALAPVRAQSQYPNQLIRWVVPYPPGGGTDNLARTLAERMRTDLGQQIVVDNRPGAATNIAAEYVARAKADGYTIIQADNAVLAFNEHLFSKLPFDPQKDFTHIGAIGRFPLAVVVHPSFPAQTFPEFLNTVRANPGKFSYASPGNGSPHHLAMELFMDRTGVDMTHIPYRGAAPAMQDLMGGQVPIMFLDLASGLPIITSGRVRPLAIGSQQRAPLLPDVPTLAEQGVADAEVYAFQGLLGPAGMPQDAVARLNQELNRALVDPTVVKRFTDFGLEILRTTPEEFQQMARAESTRWGTVIRGKNISLG